MEKGFLFYALLGKGVAPGGAAVRECSSTVGDAWVSARPQLTPDGVSAVPNACALSCVREQRWLHRSKSTKTSAVAHRAERLGWVTKAADLYR